MRSFVSSFRLSALVSLAVVSVALTGCGGGTTNVGGAPVITVGTTISSGTVGTLYSAMPNIAGGTAPYTCTFTGALPGNVVANNCTLTGTPSTGGTYPITVTVTDSSSIKGTGSANISLVINAAPLVLSTTSLPTATVGISYVGNLVITGGTQPYTCSQFGGSLPVGLGVTADCRITGSAVAGSAGNYTVVVRVTDSAASPQVTSGSISITVAVGAAPTGTRVLSGSLPVIGASVQIYAAGKTGNGSAPTALLSTPMVTDTTGKFVVDPTKYTCPTSSIIYLVSTGGKAGAGGAVSSGNVLMSSPGVCSNLNAASNFVINEATTVASAYAFAQFMATGAKIGASATNALGITLAAGTLANLVDVTAGVIPGPLFPPNGTAPTSKLNFVADLLNVCLTEQTSAPCTLLYTYSTPSGGTAPTNTLDAAFNLARNPGLSTTAAYSYIAGMSTVAYQPIPATQPSDWTLFINYQGGGMNDPTAVSIDANGRVWVANYFSVASLFTNTGTPVFSSGLTGNGLLDSYGGAVDKTNRFWVANEEGGPGNVGSISVFNTDGSVATNTAAGGYNFPIAVSFGTDGAAWIVDYGNSHLSIVDSTTYTSFGSAPYTTSQFIFPVAVAVDSKQNGWVANQSTNTVTKVARDGSSFTSYACCNGASGVAIDGSDNVWVANYYGDSIGLVSSAGVVKSGSDGYVGGGVDHPQGIAVDGAGTVWNTNYRGPSLSAFTGATTPTPGIPLTPSAGLAPDAQLLEAFGIAIDASGNAWVTNFGSNLLTEFVGLAAPVKTPLIGPVAIP